MQERMCKMLCLDYRYMNNLVSSKDTDSMFVKDLRGGGECNTWISADAILW